MLIELYETHFGICNHLNNTNPLASVQFNEAENYLKDYIYDSYLATFLYKDLGKKLNMSFDDFINRPRYEIESILRVVNEVDIQKNKINESILQNLEKSKIDKNMNFKDIE